MSCTGVWIDEDGKFHYAKGFGQDGPLKPVKLEQLELFPDLFNQCPHCRGTGEVHNGTDYMTCGRCRGTGRIK